MSRNHTPSKKNLGISSLQAITDHVETHVGIIDTVFHELISECVHIVVHWVKPTNERPFHTLVTSGMSDQPMKTPEGGEDGDYAE